MTLIEPSFEIIEQGPGITGIKKHIEQAGRTCYKSLDKITDKSCEGFVDRMVKSNHTAMLEHGTIYLTIPKSDNIKSHIVEKYEKNKFSVVKYNTPDCDEAYITTNYRVIVENHWEDDIDRYMVEPTDMHEKRYTVKFTTNIHFYKDVTRHRVFSWAIESTRFCNYIKDKFGGSVAFINPCWLKESKWYQRWMFFFVLLIINIGYKFLVKTGWQAQQAATILPQATKADVIMTGFSRDWEHFFNLRALGTTGAPHPQVKELAYPLMEEFITRGYINDIRQKKERQ